MSDLQCPATLLIARHGDAGYPVHGVLSDLGGWLTELGRGQVRELADTLRPRRVSAVYSSRMQRAVESGQLAAAHLGVKMSALEGLQEFSWGELAGVGYQDPRARQVFDAWLQGDLDTGYPGGEDGHVVIKRFTEVIEEIADAHRGETVLVFTHSGVMSLVIPRVSVNARNDAAAQRPPDNGAYAEMVVDADGWRIVSWPPSV